MIFKALFVGVALFSLSSCSFSADSMRTLTVRVRQAPALKKFSGPTIDAMDCLAVVVSGPGLANAGCVPSVTSVLVPPTQNVISLKVPSGGKRLVQVMGLSTGSGCPTGKTLTQELTSTPVASWPSLYVLGQGTFDIFKDAAVKIEQSYDSATSGSFVFPACISSAFKTVVYTLNSDGSITILHYDPVNHATTYFDRFQDGNLSAPFTMTIDPSNKFLFVSDTPNNIVTYSIKNLDGDLSFISRSANLQALDMVLAPQPGTSHLLGWNGSIVSLYDYTAGGTVTLLDFQDLSRKAGLPAGSKTSSFVPSAWLAADPLGRAAYITGAFQMNSVLISGTSFGGINGVTGSGPLAVTPTGSFVYTGAPGSGNTNRYTINADGTLQSPVSVGTSSNIESATIDRTGRFLFIGDSGGFIDSFAINAGTGALTAIGTAVAGNGVEDMKFDPLDTALFTGQSTTSLLQQLNLDATSGALGTASPRTIDAGALSIAIAKIPISFAGKRDESPK